MTPVLVVLDRYDKAVGRLTVGTDRHSYPLQLVICCPVQVGRGESGLLPDRTQGAGLSRRLAGEVYGLT